MREHNIQLLTRAETWLLLTTIFYFLINGAQIFETLVLVPKWTASPPDSFHFFAGKHALDLKTFWVIAHSIHELTLVPALVFCRGTAVFQPLLFLTALHFAVRAWTLLYFAPAILHFQKLARIGGTMPELTLRVRRWKNLNYLRVGISLFISFALVALCLRMLSLEIF